VAEEVVLAADLLVEDLAAEAADSVVDLAEASLRWLEWRLVTDSVNIVSKSCKLQLFFVITLCHYLRKTLVSSCFIPVNFIIIHQ
jgi:hypothetical protein